MEGQLPPPQQQQQQRQRQRARASPPPDPEAGQGSFADYDPPQFATATMQPPRLQQVGCCNRLIAAAACCVCLLSALAGGTWLLHLPAVAEARAGLRSHSPPPRKPLPAILHRYGIVHRAGRTGRRGADPATLRAAFPHWRDADGGLAIEAVVSDLALGLAAVVEQLDPGQELRIVNGLLSPPPPPAPAELPLAKGKSDEETEL